jgi:hypothetical protein
MTTFEEPRKSAFDYASEATKQLITLATGVIAVSITFSKDIIGNTTAHRGVLIGSWIAYIVSIVAGVWALLALTGELQPRSGTKTPSIRGKNVTWPAIIQIILFLGATAALVAYAGLTFNSKATPTKTTTTIVVKVPKGR